MPFSCSDHPGARKANATRSGKRPSRSRSRSSGSRVSSESKWSRMMGVRRSGGDGRLGQPALASAIVLAFPKRLAFAFGDAEIELLDVLVLAQRAGLPVEHHPAILQHIAIARVFQGQSRILLGEQ